MAGLLVGTFVVSFGLHLLHAVEAVTGGTAGLALLVGYATGLPFGAVFVGVNLPFLALGWWQKGWVFTLRTLVAVALVSALSSVHPAGLGELAPDPRYTVLAGNLLIGIGMLIVFRHSASLGGFNILALLAQERLGWRAGYVQLGFDVAVVLLALTVVPPAGVLLSAAGAVVLNTVLAMNHRPGRYLGH
ncbi:YitT family protein [Kocuria sabuli]|uniref:YitT family protein n=1 Tax=Kocuria sabuli TaxID=3071448 RepID=UPI0034D63291